VRALVWNDGIIGSGSVGRDFAPDLEDLARLEVVRGPGSAFYGQGAFFGVLNAVSLAPGEGPKLAAAAALLSDGGSRAHVRGSLTSERAGAASVAVSAYGSTGSTHFFEEFAGTPSAGFVRDADGETALRGSLRWRLGDLSLDAAFNRRDKEIPTATFGTVFDPAHASGTGGTVESTLDNRGYLEARYERSALLLRLYGDYAAYTGTYPYVDAETGPFVLEDVGSGFGVGGEARVSFTAPAWNRLTLGAEAARQDLEIENLISGPQMDFRHQRVAVSVAGYAVDELQLGPVRVTADQSMFPATLSADQLPLGRLLRDSTFT